MDALQRILDSVRAEQAVAALQTSRLDLHPAHDRHGDPRGYRASSGVLVLLSDVAAPPPGRR